MLSIARGALSSFVQVALGSAAWAGVLRLARGPGALSLDVFSNVRTWTFIVAASMVVGFEVAAQRADDEDPRSPRDRWLALGTGLALTLVLTLGPAVSGLTDRAVSPMFVVGVSLLLAGGVLRASSIRTLGASFVTDPRPRARLVESSIYRRIRHPSESGLYLIALGGLLACSGPLSFVGASLTVLFSLLRLRREEAALELSFGDSYRDYVRRVPALIPRLVSRRMPS